MTISSAAPVPCRNYELRFASLFNDGRGLAFPCDAKGRVDLDRLPRRARDNYLVARALVGHDYAWPQVYAQVVTEQ